MVTMKRRGAVRTKVIGVVLILICVVGGFFLWQRAEISGILPRKHIIDGTKRKEHFHVLHEKDQ